ncbi:MAG TPA: single-stranded-DNA-specific exonuclease RecJ, partial [Casimicrobiaceae bacterium]
MTPAIVRRAVPAAAAALVASGIDPLLARLYASRGIREAGELDHSLGGLPPPSLMKGIDAAAQRLVHAIDARERIVIVADYDADGATACAIGLRALRAMGADVHFLVPNRFEHGYGLTPEIVALAQGMGARLIVTVDNGIASVEGVTAAATIGIDVLVTDHHLPGERLPSPALIVDPNQPGCGFPSKHVAGVGVMFYVLAATRALLRERGRDDAALPNLASLLDIVALGTVADVVRLDRVNRIFVDQGLRRIRAGRAHAGIAALFAVAGRDASLATATDLGFVAGPRINAAGRLADMSLGIRCLTTDDEREAFALATELDRMNRERRAIEATIEEEALADLDALAAGVGDRASVCVHRATWHQGVVGIVASRLKDRVHRPVIVFAPGSDGELRGSGRSIEGFHLRDALDLVSKREPGAILRFGGHAFAAGLTLR